MQNGCHFEADRNNIAEVGVERGCILSCILRYEVMHQLKLSYFSLKVSWMSLTSIFDQFKKPNDVDLKSKLKIFNMGVNFI